MNETRPVKASGVATYHCDTCKVECPSGERPSVERHSVKRPGVERHSGFTLIELLTVLAITLVLLAIAYPGYATYVVKARRVEAQAALLELMHKQERYFTQHNTYVAFSADAVEPEAKRFRWWSGADAASSGYELRGEACPDQPIERCIVIKAVPGTDRVDASFRDASCQTLTLTSTGAHSADGPDPGCWP